MEQILINEIRSAIKVSEQQSIFDSSSPEQKLEDACAAYLKSKGYRISKAKQFIDNIESTDELIKHFYLLLNSRCSEEYITSFNRKKDLGIAKKFIEERMLVTEADKPYVLNECGCIIRTVFEHEKEFNFTRAIDFSIFGQDNLKWVTDKALQIMNREMRKLKEENEEYLRERMIEAQDKTNLGFDNLDELLATIEEAKDG